MDAYTERFLAGACPIVASYGARDRANRGTAGKLAQAPSGKVPVSRCAACTANVVLPKERG